MHPINPEGMRWSSGLVQAKSIISFLKSNLHRYNLTRKENYNDASWHSRVVGCFGTAGALNGYLVESGRRFNDRTFLELYRELFVKKLGGWELTPYSSTEIDLIYLDPRSAVEVALCEYENAYEIAHAVKDNVAKSCAFGRWKKPLPHLGIISFWCGNDFQVEEETIRTISDAERKDWGMWWLLVPFSEKEGNVFWRYSILTPEGVIREHSREGFLLGKVP